MALRNVLSLVLALLVASAAGAACACATSHQMLELHETHEMHGSSGAHASHGMAEHAGGHADDDCHHEVSLHLCPHGCTEATAGPEAFESVASRLVQPEDYGDETEPVHTPALLAARRELGFGPRPPEQLRQAATPVNRSDQLNE